VEVRVRAQGEGDGEAGGGRRVPGAGARLLLAAAVKRAGGRADPGREAVHGQGLLRLS